MKALRPFFNYYGGKWRLAGKHYPPPEHETIREPFAGSAGYSLRYPDRRVHLHDTCPVICGVWAYLIRASEQEILSLPDVGHDESVDALSVPQEARWLIGFWLNKGVSSPRKTPSAWMRSGVRPGSFWGSRVRTTIASQLGSIRHWRVRNESFDQVPNEEATWFVDPPYEGAGRHYKHGASGIDYAALSKWSVDRKGQVVVCENYGATWLPFEPLAQSKTAREKHSMEAVWTSKTMPQLPINNLAMQ